MKKYITLLLVLVFILGCTEKQIGGERDKYGCLIAAGYSWCEAKQKCLREWEEPCINIETRAKEFCDDENVANVYICGDYIRVVSSLAGAGSTIYRNDGSEVQCPVVALDAMTDECKGLVFQPDCREREIC